MPSIIFPTTNISNLYIIWAIHIIKISALIIIPQSISHSSAILIFICVCNHTINKLIIRKISHIICSCLTDIELSFPIHLSILPFANILAYRTYVYALIPMSLIIDPRPLIIMILGIVKIASLPIFHSVFPLSIIYQKQIASNLRFKLINATDISKIFIQLAFSMRFSIFKLPMILMLFADIKISPISVRLSLTIQLSFIHISIFIIKHFHISTSILKIRCSLPKGYRRHARHS